MTSDRDVFSRSLGGDIVPEEGRRGREGRRREEEEGSGRRVTGNRERRPERERQGEKGEGRDEGGEKGVS